MFVSLFETSHCIDDVITMDCPVQSSCVHTLFSRSPCRRLIERENCITQPKRTIPHTTNSSQARRTGGGGVPVLATNSLDTDSDRGRRSARKGKGAREGTNIYIFPPSHVLRGSRTCHGACTDYSFSDRKRLRAKYD